MTNSFVWTDLSTFDLRAAKQFYSAVFGWSYRELEGGYWSCEAGGHPAAGLFTMPETFQGMGMPSFWMSYVQVRDVEQTVRLAEAHGGKVEVKPQPAPGGGVIALIRDPAGAGFTCYEGPDLGGRNRQRAPGCMAWNELHVSDLETIRAFYNKVMGWHIEATGEEGRFEIFKSVDDPEPIAGIQVSSREIKGDKEYWGVYFAVSTLSGASKQIERSGGRIVAEQPLGSRPALLAYDPQGAAFYVVGGDQRSGSDLAAETGTIKWRASLGLLIVAAAILLDADWIWGFLFLLWVIPDVRRGSTHFLEHIERRKNPVIYWLIVSTWSVLAIYLMVEWLWGP